MKKVISMLLIGVFAVGILAGCSGGDTADADKPAPNANTTAGGAAATTG